MKSPNFRAFSFQKRGNNMETMHPGIFLKEAYIEPLGFNVDEYPDILKLVNGELGIDDKMATKLEAIFGRSAESWKIMQHKFEEQRKG